MPTIQRIAYAPRILRRFESIDGLISFSFPIMDYEYESEQPMRAPTSLLIGADYGFDHLNTGVALKDFAQERVRFTIYERCGPGDIDTTVDLMRSNLFRAGLGKGWVQDYQGNLRWAYMRLTSMPTYTVLDLAQPRSQILLAATAEFRRNSDWYDETLITKVQAITVSGQTFTVTNHGNIAAVAMTIRLRANSASGFTNPKLTNNTNNYVFQTNRDSVSTSSEIKLDTREPSVKFSSNDGATYSDDFANYVLPAIAQRPLSFRLEPGQNTIAITNTGTTNFNVEFSADAPFA